MNKKGIASGILILLIASIAAASMIGYVAGVTYFSELNKDNYDGKATVEPDAPIIVHKGDVEQDTFSKRNIITQCEIHKKRWGGLEPYLSVKAEGIVSCMSCSEFNSYSGNIEILDGFYKSLEKCDCGGVSCEPDSEVFDAVEKEEKKAEEEADLRENCPPIIELNGKAVLRDYICEWKVKLGQYFKPLMIGAGILAGLILFLVSLQQMNIYFKKKKYATMKTLISLVIGVIFGIILYLYFFWAIVAVIVYIIIVSILPMYFRKK